MRSLVLGFLAWLPGVALASELDDVKGWRATRSITVAAAGEFVQPRVADPEAWAAWAPFGQGMKVTCEGAAGATGRTCTYADANGKAAKVAITAADAASVHYDYWMPDLTVASKGILSWAAGDGGVTVTWDTAGTTKSVPKELKKTAGDVFGADIDRTLAALKTTAEGDAAHAAAAAAAEKKAGEAEAAAKAVEDEAAKAKAAADTAKTAADAATAAIATAGKKEKAAAEAAAAEATKAFDAAKAASEAAATKAAEARKAADAARAEAKALSEKK